MPKELEILNQNTELYPLQGENSKYGFYGDTDWVIPCIYNEAKIFSEGLAAVNILGKWGFIDTTGNCLIPFKYEYVESFLNKFSIVRLGGKFGFIDKQDNLITPLVYDEVRGFDSEMAAIMLEKKWGFVNKVGRIIVPVIYDFVDSFINNFVAVKLNEKWSFLNRSGEPIIPFPFIYEEVLDFSEGLAAVKKDNKWGFINDKGEVILPFSFDDTHGFLEGFAAVKLNGKWGFINKEGIGIIPYKYNKVTNFSKSFAIDITTVLNDKISSNVSVINLLTKNKIYKNNNNIPMLLTKVECEVKIISKLQELFYKSIPNDDVKPKFEKKNKLMFVDLSGIEYELIGGFNIPFSLKNDFQKSIRRDFNYPEFDNYEDEVDSYGTNYSKYGGYSGFSDDVIDDAFEGDPDNTWNVD